MILDQIIRNTRSELNQKMRRLPLEKLVQLASDRRPSRSHRFLKALTKSGQPIRLICELKKKSPSEGMLKKRFPVTELARQFEQGGAVAISVLTDKKYFGGSNKILIKARKSTRLPILRKDFILEPYQVYETFLIGADAFLLIASLLDSKQMKHLIRIGTKLGLDALVEIRSRQDLVKALSSGAKIIGINNRNLKTMAVDSSAARSLARHIPRNKIVVIESGIRTFEDIRPWLKKNIRVFLVGTTLMKSKNISQTLSKLNGESG